MFITGVGTISDLRAWLVPSVSISGVCHGGEILSCVVCPPASTIIMSTTLQIHFLSWLITKENQIILNWVLSSTWGNYCQNWASLCWSVTSRVWGLCCGFLIPVPPRPPQVATSLQSVSLCLQFPSVGAEEEETILIPCSLPSGSPLDHLLGIKHPSPALYSDMIWRGVAGWLIRNATHCFITLATDNLVSNLSCQ